jgi:hypothetical protein
MNGRIFALGGALLFAAGAADAAWWPSQPAPAQPVNLPPQGAVSTPAADEQQRRDKLTEHARALVPLVVRQQAGRLAKFQADHQKDVDAFHFRCERYGDFLSVFAETRGGGKIIEAINLNLNSPISLANGHAPDLNGKATFGTARGQDRDEKGWHDIVTIEGAADLPESDTASVRSYDHDDRSLPVTVEGIARSAENDIVTFGQDVMQPTSMSSMSSWLQPSMTVFSGSSGSGYWIMSPYAHKVEISVPAGLGAHVFQQILDCMLPTGTPPSAPAEPSVP